MNMERKGGESINEWSLHTDSFFRQKHNVNTLHNPSLPLQTHHKTKSVAQHRKSFESMTIADWRQYFYLTKSRFIMANCNTRHQLNWNAHTSVI